MQAVYFIARKTLKKSVCQHGASSTRAFFRWLENEHRCSGKIAGFRQIARCPEKHCGVAVMAAAVEAAGNFRAIGQVGRLLHRQGIHIRPQADGAARTERALQHTHHTCSADTAMNFDTP